MKILIISVLFLSLSECCDQNIEINPGESQTISTPNFPRPYPIGTRCTFNVNSTVVSKFVLHCNINTPSIFLCGRSFRITSPGLSFVRRCGRRSFSEIFIASNFTLQFIGVPFFRFFYRGMKCSIQNMGASNSTNNPTCPCEQDRSSNRIIRGNVASEGEYPSIVQLTASGFFFCDGTIVSDTQIITAAHCVDNNRLIIVVAGAHTRPDRGDQTQRRTVVRRSIHPGWNRRSRFLRNDIAVVTVDRPFKFTERVNPVCLPNAIPNFSSRFRVTAAGWGRYSLFLPFASPLLKEAVDLGTRRCMSTSQFCTRNKARVCFGDSGGPAISVENNDLQGVVSFTVGRCSRRISGFTSVGYFLHDPTETFLQSALGSKLCIPS